MAVFNMIPLIRADTLDGATGWASGSQTCKGTTPALAAKPKKAKKNATAAQWGGNVAWRMASKVYQVKPSNPVAEPAMSPKERRMAIAPIWATTKYKKAALRFSVFSSSNMTRK